MRIEKIIKIFLYLNDAFYTIITRISCISFIKYINAASYITIFTQQHRQRHIQFYKKSAKESGLSERTWVVINPGMSLRKGIWDAAGIHLTKYIFEITWVMYTGLRICAMVKNIFLVLPRPVFCRDIPDITVKIPACHITYYSKDTTNNWFFTT